MSLIVSITRKAASLQYQRDPAAKADWHNNDANNSLDLFEVYEASDLTGISGVPIFSSRAQTVSNVEGIMKRMLYSHTVAPGTFELRLFVEPRSFYGRIHGICNCYTIGGDLIGAYSVIMGNENRWLVHDWQKHRDTAPPGSDTRVAWSAGCFVLPDHDLAVLGQLFDHRGLRSGDVILGQLIQEG